MKRIIQLTITVLFFCSLIEAQVIADFESGMNDFKQLWGNLPGIGVAANPSGTGQVLSIPVNGSAGQMGAFGIEKTLDVKGAYLVGYWIYLPADAPDDLLFKIFAQDNNSWGWNENDYLGVNIPKGVWYPIYFDMAGTRAKATNFDHIAYQIGKMGIEVAHSSWQGTIYIDNVTLNGSEPKTLADFETGLNDFKQLWGNLAGISQTADPSGVSAGVLSVSVNGAGGQMGAFGVENTIDASEANLISFLIYLPADAPDDLLFKVFAQDNASWAWNENDYTGVNIPKGKWYPIYFDMAGTKAKTTNFDHIANKIGKMGIEVAHSSWQGTIYVDNVSLLGAVTGSKYIVADFNSQAGGTYNFLKTSWAPNMNSIEWGEFEGEGVLVANMTLNSAGESKAVIQRGNMLLKDTEGNTATKYTLDIYCPADMPLGGQVGFVFNGAANNYTWTEFYYHVTDSTGLNNLVRGQWSQLSMPIDSLITAGHINPDLMGEIYVQIYYSSAQTWTGNVYFDNLIIHGINPPAGTIAPPALTTSTQTEEIENTGKTVYYVRFDWVDNTLGTETYNIYASHNPITDINAEGVQRIAMGIPHGLQRYAHRPYSSDGAIETYYYLITSTDGINETPIADQSKSGPIQIQTTQTYKIKYVADFASQFALDGLDNEFEPYKVNQIIPETASDSTWTPESTDLNFKVTMVMDDKYLYISSDVTDDDLRKEGQSWQGDALEFYIGYYDTRTLKSLHEKNFSSANGDWRIGFHAAGTIHKDGGDATTIPGVEATVFEKLTADGYIIEARLALDSLAKDHKFLLSNGMRMPVRIDNTDWDPTKGDTERSLLLQIGGVPTGGAVDMEQDWLRPHAWGLMEVIDAPTGVADESNLPKVYALFNNYPNPFNPATTIRYDLPKESQVTLKVFDILGREVATLVNEMQKPGFYRINFNAANLASGVYVYKISAGTFEKSMKMLLIK